MSRAAPVWMLPGVVFGLLLGASPALAAEAEAEGDEDDAPAAKLAAGIPVSSQDGDLALGLNASLRLLLGQGSFASGAGANPSFISQLSVQPTLQYGAWTFFAGQAVSIEYTEPDNGSGRRLTLFDTSLGVLRPIELSSLNTRLQLSGGFLLPVSHQSRAMGSFGGIFLGLTALYRTPLKGLTVVLGGRGQAMSSVEGLRSVPDDSRFEDRSLGTLQASTCLTRVGESAANACGPVPNVGNLSGSLRLSYGRGAFFAVLGTSIMTLVRAYDAPDDAFTPDGARTGRLGNTFTSGTASLNYQFAPWLVMGAGTQSFQPLRTANGKNIRFPFWNFTGSANNFSSLFVASTFIY